MSERLILATDLDGTLAHGSAAERAELIAALRAGPGAQLIYVTGRTPASARALLQETSLPEPDVLIADVGSSVLHGAGPERIAEIEHELGADWPGASAIHERLAGYAALVPQDVTSPRRVAYWIEPVRAQRAPASADADPFTPRAPGDASFDAAWHAVARQVTEEATQRLAPLPVDVLMSGNVFLDVLPRGVHKGSTLQRVLRWLGADADVCVVAGDSLNDIALFETGLRGILVGNCEPALRQRVRDMAQVYRARGAGAAGVLEGLRHHGYLGSETSTGERHGQ